jgi:hypothetical protein
VASVGVVLVLLLLLIYIGSIVRGRRGGVVAKRGIGIGADLGTLADAPRVRVRSVTRTGLDRVRVVLALEAGSDSSATANPADLDLLVSLQDGDFGSDLLEQWRQSDSSIAIVIPPDSRLVRLRSTESLQNLTLRRVEEG